MYAQGLQPIINAAKKYFRLEYQNPTVYENQEIVGSLKWIPTLHFHTQDFQTIIIEASTKVYPDIFLRRHADILNLHMPITVFCACPEDEFLRDQQSFRELVEHGYGLISIDGNGSVLLRNNGIPLIQRLNGQQFQADVRALPPTLKQKLAGAYRKYAAAPISGVSEITEIVEAMTLKAAQDAVRKGWLASSDVKPGKTAAMLDSLTSVSQLKNAKASLGGARSYIAEYRNLAHHAPKNKNQAYKKYGECKDAFLEGVRKIKMLNTQLKSCGLSGGV